ncbi:ribosomal-protein-alanine N-acetyltransferase [filamentous cyanobacterium CCP5]|nr:ribosomal-protein-alanine N-acetyltransferase [filamentous cyanobacterium CCP5]
MANQIPAMVKLDQCSLGGMWSESGYRRELDSPNSVLRILQNRSDHIIGLGCFWAITDEAHITLLAIAPGYQRQGLGRWLLWQLLREAHEHQLHHATLEVRLGNAIAQKLYHQFGFQALGQRKRYYPDDEDALILWRSGLERPGFAQELAVWKTTIASKLDGYKWHLANRDSLYKSHQK